MHIKRIMPILNILFAMTNYYAYYDNVVPRLHIMLIMPIMRVIPIVQIMPIKT